MNKKAFGLDIGATTIKLVWLDKQNNGFLLSAASMVPTPSKGMLSESLVDQEDMAFAIKKAVTDANITTKYVNVALPENQVYTKVLEMPVLSDRELRSAIFWEAEQYIPVPLTNVTLTWTVLKRPEQQSISEKMQVLMVGAPTILVAKYQKILSLAGFSIHGMETEILATLRSLIVGNNSPSSLVINIGAVSTSFAIVKEQVMVFTYSTSVGGSAISRAIETDFGLTLPQAEEYKRVYGVSDKTLGGKIGQATQPILNSILIEAKKALAYYSEKYKAEQPIRQVILSGGTAKLPGIEVFFAENLGIEAVIANPWKVLVSGEVPKEILDNAPDYTIAVGLAMRDYE